MGITTDQLNLIQTVALVGTLIAVVWEYGVLRRTVDVQLRTSLRFLPAELLRFVIDESDLADVWPKLDDEDVAADSLHANLIL